MISLVCGILKIIQMNLFKNQNRLTDIEDKSMVTEEGRGERNQQFGINICILLVCMKGSEVAQSCPTLPPHGLQLTRLLCPWNFPGKSTGVGCHFLLQGIFLTQGSNLGLPHCRQTLYLLSHQGSCHCMYSRQQQGILQSTGNSQQLRMTYNGKVINQWPNFQQLFPDYFLNLQRYISIHSLPHKRIIYHIHIKKDNNNPTQNFQTISQFYVIFIKRGCSTQLHTSVYPGCCR